MQVDGNKNAYMRFYGTLVAPWWAAHPLHWSTPLGVGLAHFAKDGRVGMFNLGWMLLDWSHRTELPDTQVYYKANVRWLVMTAPMVEGERGITLEHWAAISSHRAFCEMLLRNRSTLQGRVVGQGMTWQRLEELARKGLKELP